MKQPMSPSPYTDHFIGIAIGQYKYPEFDLGDLGDNPLNDMRALYKVLVRKYGLLAENCTFLENENAIRENILDAIEAVGKKVTTNDRLIILFCGHGKFTGPTNTERGFWVPYDGKNTSSTWIGENDLRSKFIYIEDCRHLLIIADSCFSGEFFSKNRGGAFSSDYDVYEARKSRWAIASGFKEVPNGPAGSNSPFMKTLIKILEKNQKVSWPIDKLGTDLRDLLEESGYEYKPVIDTIAGAGHKSGLFVFHQKISNLEKAKELYDEIVKEDTLEAYKYGVLNIPEKGLQEKAMYHFRQKASDSIKKAIVEKNIDFLLSFIANYQEFSPSSADEAKKSIDLIKKVEQEEIAQIAYSEAEKEGTLIAFERFLKVHGLSRFAIHADSKIQEIRDRDILDKILSLDSPDEIRKVLESPNFPNKHRKESKSHLKTILWRKLENQPSPEYISDIEKEFGDELLAGERNQLTQKRLEIAEDKEYERVSKSTHIADWIQFFNTYRAGKHIDKAYQEYLELSERMLYKNLNGYDSKPHHAYQNKQFDKIYEEISGVDFWTEYEKKAKNQFDKTERYQEVLEFQDGHVRDILKYLQVFPESAYANELWRKAKRIEHQYDYDKSIEQGTLQGLITYWQPAKSNGNSIFSMMNALKYCVGASLFFLFLFLFYTFAIPKFEITYAKCLVEIKNEPYRALGILQKYPNDPIAISYLATSYHDANQMEKAIPYYEKAMQAGINRAFFSMGIFHINRESKLIAPDTAKGIELIRQAFALKEPRAAKRLSEFYDQGLGNFISIDKAKSAQYAQKAKELGYTERTNIGITVNNVELTRIRAIEGEADAQLELGLHYVKGEDVDTCTDMAIYWFTQALLNGKPSGAIEIGRLYEKEKDYKLANQYYQIAIDKGEVSGYALLGNAYHRGQGVVSDINKAIYHYRRYIENSSNRRISDQTMVAMGLTKIYNDSLMLNPKHCIDVVKWLTEAYQGEMAHNEWNIFENEQLLNNDFIPGKKDQEASDIANMLTKIYFYKYCQADFLDIETAGLYTLYSAKPTDTAEIKFFARHYFRKGHYRRACYLYNLLPNDFSSNELGIEAIRSIHKMYIDGKSQGELPASKVMNWLEGMIIRGYTEFMDTYVELKYSDTFVQSLGSEAKYRNGFGTRNNLDGGDMEVDVSNLCNMDMPRLSIIRRILKSTKNTAKGNTLAGLGYALLADEENITFKDSSVYYYRLAVDQGDPFAIFFFAKHLKEKKGALYTDNSDEAIRLFEKLLSTGKANRLTEITHFFLGELYYNKQNREVAKFHFDKVLEINKQNSLSLNCLCNMYYPNDGAKGYCIQAASLGESAAKEKCHTNQWPYKGYDPNAPEKGFWEKLWDKAQNQN